MLTSDWLQRVDEVVADGPGLVFVVFPHALAQMPCPQVSCDWLRVQLEKVPSEGCNHGEGPY